MTFTLEHGPFAEDSGPFPFERRNFDRWPAEGGATAFRLAGPDFGQMHDLRMLDFSDEGLGAISRTVIEPGTVISVGFQQPGAVARRGVVTRCIPCGDGYRIGVRFEGRLAA